MLDLGELDTDDDPVPLLGIRQMLHHGDQETDDGFVALVGVEQVLLHEDQDNVVIRRGTYL